RVPGLPLGLEVALDAPPTPGHISAVVSRALDVASSVQGPVHPFAQLLADDIARPWQHTSATSLDVPFALAGDEPVILSLGSQKPPHPNVRDGAAVGQGKFNSV